MELDFQTGVLLLMISAAVAMITRRLHLPYSVGLVGAGIEARRQRSSRDNTHYKLRLRR